MTTRPEIRIPAGVDPAAPARPVPARPVPARPAPARPVPAGIEPAPTGPAGTDAVLATAGREVLMARNTGCLPGEPGGPLRRVDLDNLRRGVRYRVLVPQAGGAPPGRHPRLPAGLTLRTVPVLPTELTVVDGTLAMLPTGRGPEQPGDLAVSRLPGVVDAVVALFHQLWSAAAPPTDADDPLGDPPDDRERELLALLAAGFTDESAAVRLGVSVRTVRRTMSAVMTRLGARSRFQAGLHMARRGLVTPDPADAASTTVGGCAGDCHGGRRGSAAGCRCVAARSGVRG